MLTDNSIYNESPKIKIYKSVKERLLTNVKELVDVRIWNNQIEEPEQKDPVILPCVFIDWTQDIFDVATLSNGLKSYTGQIYFKVVIEGYTSELLQIYPLVDKIKSLLDGWCGWEGQPLSIIGDKEDETFNNIKVLNIICSASWYEYSYSTQLIAIGGTSGNTYGITVEIEQDSNFDNAFLRGGTTFNKGFEIIAPASTAGTSGESVTIENIVNTELPNWDNIPMFPIKDLGI